VDPVASLRAAEIEIELGEWVYLVPAMQADEWIEVLAARSPIAVVPGLLHPEDRVRVLRDLLAKRVSPDEVLTASRQVIEAAGGRRWWTVQRLVESALADGTWAALHGQMLLKGMDLSRITLAGFVNAVFVLALQGCEKQVDRDRLQWEIDKPPPGFADEVEGTSEGEFMAMLGDQRRIAGAADQQMIGP
jgi:hypothetical protein